MPDKGVPRGLTEEFVRACAAGKTVDFAALAERYSVSLGDVEAWFLAVAGGGAQDAGRLEAGEAHLPLPALPKDFEIIAEIGQGGMGIVYQARQISLGREVAVKVLRPGELWFAEALRRFRRESQSLARLRHPHIVSIHEVGEVGGNLYYTMDLIRGSSLAQLIQESQVTPARATSLLRQVAGAISYAHSQGIIHRDLKPANVLVGDDGNAYVVDFGLARDAALKGDLTATGHLLGTPAYMSPEQARGESSRISEATDIYSLGAILYECLTGRAPFEAPSIAELVEAVIRKDPVPPRRLNPAVPRDLEVICLKALSKEAERRYPTVLAFLEDLGRFEEGRPIRARPMRWSYRAIRFARRNRKALIGSAVAAGLGAAIIGLLVFLILLPRLGQTPEKLLESGESLHGEGEHRAASLLFERALREKAWWPLPEGAGRDEKLLDAFGDPLVPGLFRSLLRCRLDVLEALVRQGQPEKASVLAREVAALCRDLEEPAGKMKEHWKLGRTFHPVEARPEAPPAAQAYLDFLWDLGNSSIRAGDPEAARKAFSIFQELVWIHADPQAVRRVQGTPGGNPMLDQLAPALVDPASPGHEAAAAYLAARIQAFGVGNKDRPREDWGLDPARWLARQGDREAPILLAGIRGLGKAPADARTLDLYVQERFYRHLALPEHADAIARLAREEALPLEVRTFAADLLCVAVDLPLRPRYDWESAQLPEPERSKLTGLDVGLLSRVLSMWDEVRTLTKLEGYRRRVELALALRGLKHEGWERSWNRWLENHTGIPPLPWQAPAEGEVLPRPELLARWTSWRDEHGREDPRSWLARALALPGIPGNDQVPALLERFLRSPRDVVPAERIAYELAQRAWLHHLLCLTIPEGVKPPTWIKAWDPTSWDQALSNVLGEKPRRIRVADFVLEGGDPVPRLLWQEVKLLRPGEEIDVFQDTDPNAAHSYLGMGIKELILGLRWRSPDLMLEYRISYHGRTEESGFGNGFNSESPAGKVAILRPGPGDKRYELQSIPLHLTLAILEEKGAEEKDWGFPEWRNRLIQSLGYFTREIEEVSRKGGSLIHRELQTARDLFPLVAAVVPLPEAAPDLARLGAAASRIPESPARPGPDPVTFALGRLLAGDAAVLDDEDFRRSLPEPGGRDRPASAHGMASGIPRCTWTRLLLSTADERIRGFALSMLERGPLTSDEAVTLVRTASEGKIVFPAPLIERARARAAQGRSVPIWVWALGGIILLAALGGALHALRRRPRPPAIHS